MDSLCHPCITATHLSYFVLYLKLPPPPCAVLLIYNDTYIHIYTYIHIHMYICIYTYICICIIRFVIIVFYIYCIYIYIYMYVCIHVFNKVLAILFKNQSFPQSEILQQRSPPNKANVCLPSWFCLFDGASFKTNTLHMFLSVLHSHVLIWRTFPKLFASIQTLSNQREINLAIQQGYAP